MRTLIAVFCFAVFLGCSSSATPSAPSAVTFSLSWSVPPQSEAYRCQFVQMPADGGDIFVKGGQSDLSPGTHHFLLYRTALTSIPAGLDQQTDCTEHGGAMQYAHGYVTGSTQAHASADLPAGVALPFQASEVLLLQAHFLNADASAVPGNVTVVLRTTPASSVQQRAGVFQFYDPFIFVPAHGSGAAAMRCPINHDITLISAGSHMHRRGVSYEAYIDDVGAPPASGPFYTSGDWQTPAAWVGDRPVAAGSFIRFRCDYTNPDAVDVVQGLSADANEMCMFGGFYYPAMSTDDEQCAGADQVGTGTASCAVTSACVDACPRSEAPDFTSSSAAVGPCWQKCIAESCPNAAAPLFAQLTCTKQSCAGPCATQGAACDQCVLASCGAAVNACQALACSTGGP